MFYVSFYVIAALQTVRTNVRCLQIFMKSKYCGITAKSWLVYKHIVV